MLRMKNSLLEIIFLFFVLKRWAAKGGGLPNLPSKEEEAAPAKAPSPRSEPPIGPCYLSSGLVRRPEAPREVWRSSERSGGAGPCQDLKTNQSIFKGSAMNGGARVGAAHSLFTSIGREASGGIRDRLETLQRSYRRQVFEAEMNHSLRFSC